ncbi:hypothetical protein ES703_66991 [subsurface metagenome]
MSFIRAKKFSNGRIYYYLVESYRYQGKGKQRVIKYLGKEDPRKGVRNVSTEERASGHTS